MAMPQAIPAVDTTKTTGRDLLKVLLLITLFVVGMVTLKYFDAKYGFLTVLAERIVKI